MAFKDLFKTVIPAKLTSLFSTGKEKEQILSELEETLILADIAQPIANRIVAGLRKKANAGSSKEDYLELLKEELLALFADSSPPFLAGNEKKVILLVGVNGSGKTTSAAKLARHFQLRGQRVLLAAADTFRAAGASQLELWGEKLAIQVISGERGTDPGSVVYNSMHSWQSKNFDRLIIDTAGRMQSKENLMQELQKIVRVIQKIAPDQPAETWLVLDASTGQNALAQAEKFKEFSNINGLILAKTDGTAKGGTIISIAERMNLPVHYVGTGESADDLWEFSKRDFVESLLSQ